MDVSLMEQAAQDFLGTHDFGAFCAHKTNKSTQRHIHSFTVERIGEEIRFTVTGNGFLHHMVRIMVGTLLEIGRAERPVDDIKRLYAQNRADAGALIPACGLCLMEVTY
jgi:tRNA pseudouridine38-40 synthase